MYPSYDANNPWQRKKSPILNYFRDNSNPYQRTIHITTLGAAAGAAATKIYQMAGAADPPTMAEGALIGGATGLTLAIIIATIAKIIK